jgi:hypothetical protein
LTGEALLQTIAPIVTAKTTGHKFSALLRSATGRSREVTQQQNQPEPLPDDVTGFLQNPQQRQAILYQLAKNYPNEYLSLVRVNGQPVPSQAIGAPFFISNKEWQE